jgi:hypothetical protein
MPTYILDPSGKVIKDGENNPSTASTVSKEILENQNDYFSDRRKNNDTMSTPSSNFLPTGLKGLAFGNPGHNIVSVEKGIIETDTETGKENYFPSKTNSENNKNLLVNSSFGYDKDNPVKYYHQFNSIFSENQRDRVVYAEELEMIAGVELNSLGLILQSGDGFKSDISLISYLFDYIIESLIYLATSYIFINNTFLSKLAPDPIKDYFNNLLHLRHDMKDRSFLTLVNYFIIGFDKYINTDSKYNAFKLDYDGTENFIEIIGHYLANTITNISKVGRNRFFLLVRKFQQESYWHSEILYKAKEDSDENPIDKFFIEFSQYYFKFMLERINIGYLVYNKDIIFASSTSIKNSGFSYLDSRNRNFDPSRSFYNKEKDRKDLERRLSINITQIQSESDEYDYNWISKNASANSRFKTSIVSLPQLLKTNMFFKDKINNINSDLSQNFASSNPSTQSRRLPIELVRKIETELENEYIPFYMHDLRTNEIISMHAFLDTISDNFSPEYTSNSGYGRIDDIKHYVKTTRSISLTFSLYSVQEEDHDLMWYQINKIVSMVYPQWSQGIPANTGKFKGNKDFRFPFTQVPTASPLIRLRVGDVLKSNYSLENLKRLHGNKKKITLVSDIREIGETYLFNDYSRSYLVGSTNSINSIKDSVFFELSLLSKEIEAALTTYDKERKSEIDNALNSIENSKNFKYIKKYNNKLLKGIRIKLEEKTDILKLYGKQSKFVVKVKPVDIADYITLGFSENLIDPIPKPIKIDYDNVREIDVNELRSNFKFFEVSKFIRGDRKISVELIAIPNVVFDKKTYFETEDTLDKSIFSAEDDDGNLNNPYTKSFETSAGQGLAGFITSLDINYQDSVWNTNMPGSNAPHGVKITIGFAPVHDISPGLDHEGLMRAPIYNVGSINAEMFDDE